MALGALLLSPLLSEATTASVFTQDLYIVGVDQDAPGDPELTGDYEVMTMYMDVLGYNSTQGSGFPYVYFDMKSTDLDAAQWLWGSGNDVQMWLKKNGSLALYPPGSISYPVASASLFEQPYGFRFDINAGSIVWNNRTLSLGSSGLTYNNKPLVIEDASGNVATSGSMTATGKVSTSGLLEVTSTHSGIPTDSLNPTTIKDDAFLFLEDHAGDFLALDNDQITTNANLFSINNINTEGKISITTGGENPETDPAIFINKNRRVGIGTKSFDAAADPVLQVGGNAVIDADLSVKGNVTVGESLIVTYEDLAIQGTNLFINGDGSHGNNTNLAEDGTVFHPISLFTTAHEKLSGAKGYFGFPSDANRHTVVSDYFIPVNVHKKYRIGAFLRDENASTLTTLSMGFRCYDIDRKEIEASMVAVYPNTQTVLLETFDVANDTEIVITKKTVSDWATLDTEPNRDRNLVFWGYTSPTTGETYEDGVYSRYVLEDAWTLGNITEEVRTIDGVSTHVLVITLDGGRMARPELQALGTLAKGASLSWSESNPATHFALMKSETLATLGDWYGYETFVTGYHDGTSAFISDTVFRPATAFIKLALQSQGANLNNIQIANIRVEETSDSATTEFTQQVAFKGGIVPSGDISMGIFGPAL
jgi:hypothetical protein